MKIIWLPLALDDLSSIDKYYTRVAGKSVANKQIQKVVKASRLIQKQPYIGHTSPNDTDEDVLEWNIPSTTYTLPYMVLTDEIRILRVFDQRQERPESWD